MQSISVATNEEDSAERFLLVIEQDLSSDISEIDELSESNMFPVNLACKPRFTYYNNHCLFNYEVVI